MNATAAEKFIVYDTNGAMHFKRADNIDWQSITQSDTVYLVVVPTFLREIDKLKYSHPKQKIRERARDFMKWLIQFHKDPSKEVRPNVKFLFAVGTETSPGLGGTSADDQLISEAVAFKAANPETYILTNDGYCRIQASLQGLEVVELPDNLQIHPELDANEAELRALRRENESLKNRLPRLSAVFSTNSGGDMQIFFGDLASDITDPPSLLTVKERFPPIAVFNSALRSTEMRRTVRDWVRPPPVEEWTQDEIENHNLFKEGFYRDYNDYLKSFYEWKAGLQRTFILNLDLQNTGRGPAARVDLRLEFPPEVTLFRKKKLPEAPKKPEPPELVPIGRHQALARSIPETIPSLASLADFHPPPYPETTVDAANNVVSFYVRELKHGERYSLDAFYVQFRDEVSGFKIKYSISCNELVEPHEGSLNLRLPG